MELGNIIIEGGLTNQKYDNQQELKSSRAAQDKERGLRAQQIAAEEGVIPFRARNVKAGLESAFRDNQFGEEIRPLTQGMAKTGLEGKARRQSTEESIKDIDSQMEKLQSEWAQKHQPTQLDIASRGMNVKNIQSKADEDSLKMRQTVLLYKKLKLAGPKAVLDDINNNDLILGDVQYKDIYMTAKDETGTDRPVQDAEQADTIMLVNPDESITPVPMADLKAMADNQGGATYETYKEGEAVYRTDSDGSKTLVGRIPKSFAPTREWYDNSETGGLYNAFTGEQRGGAAGGKLTRKEQEHLDGRVKQADAMIRGYLWQSSQFAELDEETQKAYGKMMGQTIGPLIRKGMDPEEAFGIAVQEFERNGALNGALGETNEAARSTLRNSMGSGNY